MEIVDIKQLKREIWLYTKDQYIMESITLAANVTIKQLKKEIKGQYMKELNTLVENVANNFLTRVVMLNTRSRYIEANKLQTFL